jgi:hypothetical protein
MLLQDYIWAKMMDHVDVDVCAQPAAPTARAVLLRC